MQGQSVELTLERVSGETAAPAADVVTEVVADMVAVEEPLEIRVGNRSLSLTMRTPGHDEELATGFLVGEGVLRSRPDLVSVISCGNGAAKGNVAKIELGPDVAVDWSRLARHFYTTSSCGVCGKASLDALAVLGTAPPPRESFRVRADVVHDLPRRLRAAQSVFDRTGGLHAAALFDGTGAIDVLREDVGRHNAVDKVVGASWLAGRTPLHDRGLFLSGRASFELLQKALVAGVPLVAAVGAPSSLAVDLARRFDVTLLGFVRNDRFNVYHGSWRIR